MITREQLELAARAAGIEVRGWPSDCPTCLVLKDNGAIWQPHIDHGQLLDLAMACKICIDPIDNVVEWRTSLGGRRSKHVDCQDFPALAEVVILAAAEQQLAKENGE